MPQSVRFATLADFLYTEAAPAESYAVPLRAALPCSRLARHAIVGFIVVGTTRPMIPDAVLSQQATSKTSQDRARVCLASLACMVGRLARRNVRSVKRAK